MKRNIILLATGALLIFSTGAYAGSRYVITSINQIKPSVLAKLKGNTRLAGAKGATGATGSTGATGPAGTNGTNGKDGTNGNTMLSGSVAPTTQGSVGDFYIDTAHLVLYGPKTANGWPASGINLAATNILSSTGGALKTDSQGYLQSIAAQTGANSALPVCSDNTVNPSTGTAWPVNTTTNTTQVPTCTQLAYVPSPVQ